MLSINANFTWHSHHGSSATVSDYPQRARDTAWAMSQENVEIVRTAIDAFNRRDAKTFAADLAQDAEIVPMRAALEGTVYRGPDAASQYCAAVDESWDNLRWEVEE